jgi:hypothetical protein
LGFSTARGLRRFAIRVTIERTIPTVAAPAAAMVSASQGFIVRYR